MLVVEPGIIVVSEWLAGVKAATLVLCLALAGCAAEYRNHGYIPAQEDLDEIKVGSDTRETVAAKVGVPSSGGVLNDSGYYYVRMRTKTLGPLATKEIERQVVAISFAGNGTVQNIERFGLEQGRVVPLQRRVIVHRHRHRRRLLKKPC